MKKALSMIGWMAVGALISLFMSWPNAAEPLVCPTPPALTASEMFGRCVDGLEEATSGLNACSDELERQSQALFLCRKGRR